MLLRNTVRLALPRPNSSPLNNRQYRSLWSCLAWNDCHYAWLALSPYVNPKEERLYMLNSAARNAALAMDPGLSQKTLAGGMEKLIAEVYADWNRSTDRKEFSRRLAMEINSLLFRNVVREAYVRNHLQLAGVKGVLDTLNNTAEGNEHYASRRYGLIKAIKELEEVLLETGTTMIKHYQTEQVAVYSHKQYRGAMGPMSAAAREGLVAALSELPEETMAAVNAKDSLTYKAMVRGPGRRRAWWWSRSGKKYVYALIDHLHAEPSASPTLAAAQKAILREYEINSPLFARKAMVGFMHSLVACAIGREYYLGTCAVTDRRWRDFVSALAAREDLAREKLASALRAGSKGSTSPDTLDQIGPIVGTIRGVLEQQGLFTELVIDRVLGRGDADLGLFVSEELVTETLQRGWKENHYLSGKFLDKFFVEPLSSAARVMPGDAGEGLGVVAPAGEVPSERHHCLEAQLKRERESPEDLRTLAFYADIVRRQLGRGPRPFMERPPSGPALLHEDLFRHLGQGGDTEGTSADGHLTTLKTSAEKAFLWAVPTVATALVFGVHRETPVHGRVDPPAPIRYHTPFNSGSARSAATAEKAVAEKAVVDTVADDTVVTERVPGTAATNMVAGAADPTVRAHVIFAGTLASLAAIRVARGPSEPQRGHPVWAYPPGLLLCAVAFRLHPLLGCTMVVLFVATMNWLAPLSH